MRVPRLTLKLISSISLLLLGARASPHRRAQCTATLDKGTAVAKRLQSAYFNIVTGEYNDGELWTDSNALEDLHNLMLGAGTNDFEDVGDWSWIGRAALFPWTDWNLFLGGSNDDAQWVILALWKIADYKAARGLDNSAYISSAAKIYDIVAGQWDDTCGGGVWWSTDHTYKNAITNELFLLTSASGYLRFANQTYLENANKEWAWLSQSGMRNSDGLFNDGLDLDTCANNGQTTWIYNQAVVASGLGALGVANSDSSLFDQAEVSLDATVSLLTENGVLKESCDASSCDSDQQIFKGIWTKHLQYYLDMANDATRTAKYSAFLGAQYNAIINNAANANLDIASAWFAPNQSGAVISPEASTSGLAGIVADAKYGPC